MEARRKRLAHRRANEALAQLRENLREMGFSGDGTAVVELHRDITHIWPMAGGVIRGERPIYMN